MKRNGFTLIELIIVIVFAMILVAIAVGIFQGKSQRQGGTLVYTYNGMIQEKCINGFAYVIGPKSIVQKVDVNGRPATCPSN